MRFHNSDKERSMGVPMHDDKKHHPRPAQLFGQEIQDKRVYLEETHMRMTRTTSKDINDGS